MGPGQFDEKIKLINQCDLAKIYEDADKYFFALKDTLLIKTTDFFPSYKSKKYGEMFNNRKYNGEKYLITANENEIAVYNLFTNNLVANFVSSFSAPFTKIKMQKGYYKFVIRKNVFDEELNKIILLYKSN